MDIEKVQALLSIVECGSIQGAARALGVPRSLLRRRLEGLEAEVGVPLLHRDAVGVQLTAAGRVVVDQGKTLLEGARSLLSAARSAAGEATGTLHVFEPIGMPLAVRAQCLLATRAALPRLRLIVREVEDPVAHLDGPCDLVLHDGPPLDRNTWFSRVLTRQRLRPIASPGYLRSHGTPHSAADLAGHEILGWVRPRHRTDAWPLLAGGSVEVSPWYTTSDLMALRTLAAAGGGILLAPDSPLLDDPGGEPLVGVLDDVVGGEMPFRVSSRLPSSADPRTRDVLEQIEKLLASFPEQ